MDETLDSEDSRIISRFSTENERLQKRVKELEALLTRREEQAATRPSPPPPGAKPAEGGNTEVTKVMQLLKMKDKTLAAYAKDLEEKTEKLEEVVSELKEKNEELTNWLAAVQLYREIFEHDPSAMIGLDGEGRIVNFNKAAVAIFGERMHILMLEEYGKLELDKVDANLPGRIQHAFKEAKMSDELVTYEGVSYRSVVYSLLAEESVRAVMLRFARA